MSQAFAGTAVIGAGVVGLCTAITLQQAGHAVTVLDGRGVGGGTSFGNAGLISIDSVVPIATPGLIRNVLRWLCSDIGPLAIHPASLPGLLPWLWRWQRQSGMRAVLRNSDGIRALHREGLALYADLLGPEAFGRLIRQQGQVHVWNSVESGAGDHLTQALNERQGVQTQALSRADLHDLVPGLSAAVSRGLLYPRGAHTVEPQALMRGLAQRLRDLGGHIEAQQVFGLVPQGTAGVELIGSHGSAAFAQVVVCAGAYSLDLLAPLGVRAPLATERGYHAHLSEPNLVLPLPVVHKELGLAFSPMASGLRVAGTVELAARDLPPRIRRTDAVLKAARQVFPALRYASRSLWMGCRPSMPDSIPVIDRLPQLPQVAMAFGHGHFGLTAAPKTAQLVRDLLQDGPLASYSRQVHGLQRF